jgi:putative transposase
VPDYRRNRVPGRTFFTVNLLDRRSNLLVARIDACATPSGKGAPAHLSISTPGLSSPITALSVDLATRHCEFSRSVAGDQDRVCKVVAYRRLAITCHEQPWRNAPLGSGGTARDTIRDDRDFAAHMKYTHFNPFEHGLVAHPVDWPHSSFHRRVNMGLYPAGWRVGSERL